MLPTIIWALMLLMSVTSDSWARSEARTDELKQSLLAINRILVEVVALTDKGSVDAAPFKDLAAKRLSELGYSVVADASQPHDVVLNVKCEQHKIWEGITASGGDADLPDSPHRTWKGPACLLSYVASGKKASWRKEVRTDFQDAEQAAAAAKASDAGAYAMGKLKERLEDYDFPAFISAEWGQDERLFTLYDNPATPVVRKVRLIALFGHLFSTKAVPRLLTGLNGGDMEMAKASALALGNIGQKETVPTLIQTMKTGQPELRPSAAKALGVLGALHGDFSIVDPLLDTLKTADDVALKTEVVWALGKLPDRKAQDQIAALQKSLSHVRGPDADPKLVKLKEAVNWTIKQIDTWEYLQ